MQNLANVHPIRDDARNMESALCHGTKETKVSEICHSQRPLDDLLTLKVRMRLWSDGMAPGIAFFIDVLDTISKELWFRKVSLLIQIKFAPPMLVNIAYLQILKLVFLVAHS